MLAFIWDLDGTLLDSYEIIVNSLYQIYLEQGIELNKDEILKEIITESVSVYILKMEEKYGIPFDNLRDRYNIISRSQKLNIKAMQHAEDILKYIKENKIPNFVYTHRGVTTETVLKNIGIYDYFDEVVTSLDNFRRKPYPDGVDYLVQKYHLDRANTFYVGDRSIDIECANNAHIKSIMFIPPQSVASPTRKETYVIHDLLDIKEIIEDLK